MVGTLGFTSFTPVLATTATWTAALPAQPGAAVAAWAIGAGAAMAVGALAALSTRLAEGRRRRPRASRPGVGGERVLTGTSPLAAWGR